MQLLHPSLRRRTVLLTASWVGSTCSYYGVTLWQLDFGGGLYLQNALGAALETRLITKRRPWDPTQQYLYLLYRLATAKHTQIKALNH